MSEARFQRIDLLESLCDDVMKNNEADLPWISMREKPNCGELPLLLQFIALGFLWFIWIATVAWVFWKADLNAKALLTFADSQTIYLILFAGIPFVLFVAGMLFIVRLGPTPRLHWVYNLFYLFFVVLTWLALFVSVIGGFWAWSIQEIRE
jgi:hypothetical protein